MPLTRSMKKQDNAPVEVHVFDHTPASPSANALSRAGTGAVPAPVFTYNTDFVPQPMEASSTAPRTDALAMTDNPSSELLLGETTPVRRNVEKGPAAYAHVARSVRSTASSNAALRDMEYRAAKELAEIRRKRLDLEEELVKKKLARDVAQIEANSVVAANDLEDSRVSLWVENVNTIRGEPPSSPLPQPANRVDIAQSSRIGLDFEPALLGRINARVGIEENERRYSEHYTNRDVAPGESRHLTSYQNDRSPTRREQSRLPSPYRHRSRSRTPGNKEKGIERLAEALEKMTRLRPASSKQAQELPVFSGSAVEWLAFKTAMKESTELYGFTHAENMGRLRVCLRGAARDAVSALLFTESDPRQIMRTLEQCFGRTETIIDRAIEDLRRLPRLGQTAQELNSFAVKLQNIVCIIRNVDGRGYLRNPMLVRYVSERLSPHLRSRWCDYAEDFGTIEEPEIVTMSKFLMREADRALSHAYTATPFVKTETTSRREKPREATILTTTPVKSETKHCLCCGGQHGVKECTKLSNMSVKERWAWAQEQKVCFNCLRGRHRRFACKEKRCGINECRGRHHELLHAERASPTEQEGSATEETALVASTSAMCESALLKVCPVLIRGPEGREIATYALLDEGSTISLIDEQLAREIGANGPTRKLSIRCVSATNDHPNSRIVNLTVRGKRQENSHEIKARTVTSLAVGVQTVSTEYLQLSHLHGLPKYVCFTNAKPKLLIGADNWHLIISRNIRIGRRNEPIAANTLLGWVIQGSTPRRVSEEDHGTVLHIRSTYSPRPEDRSRANKDDKINALLKRRYDIDSLGISLITKPRHLEERALKRFNDTVRKIDGQYNIGRPWKDDVKNNTREVIEVNANAGFVLASWNSIKSEALSSITTDKRAMTAKIQLQDLWTMKLVSWDDEQPPSAREEFQSGLYAIREAATLRLPRCYASTGGVVERQLHIFNDASDKAFATVAYWLTQYEDGSFRVSLIGAKEKVAPIKAQSIPRLELQASLKGARLADAIQTEHRIKAQKVRLWTVSQTVPVRIRNCTSRYREIAERTTPEQWRCDQERVGKDLGLVFHITRLRPTLREVERSCMLCKVRKATPRSTVTGDLPTERLGAYARPFTYMGVDYFGPLIVTIGRRREKRWVALFTCLTTRAIHLELVYSLTADSAIMALRRMAARRGWPRVVYSDNGTNFRGASKEIYQATADWEPALRGFALTRRFDWKFIAPGAPNQGGAWERLVRSVKPPLQSTLKEKQHEEDTLTTLLAEAEVNQEGQRTLARGQAIWLSSPTVTFLVMYGLGESLQERSRDPTE
ncbi:uncharacterized protein LOC123723049 [Papilio machaon]|uniref:uncharacterized protein LOC123723049 n=1 Tax=Papilio machaon TaxID=76193 RepID=UPI001E663FA2|nr:uncharacterized protein LOC123723049 [Papilio machaon]